MTITDNIINDWWNGLAKMKTYHHCHSKPATAFSRWGVTLIPPESLNLFKEIIDTFTSPEFKESAKIELADLYLLIEKAKQDNKFIIHYGI